MRGAFILFEGVDRCGKTTQSRLLYEYLIKNNHDVELIRYPNRTTSIGQMIDSYLQSQTELDDKAIHLMFSANRWETVNDINEFLNSGKTIICDRYAYSGVAFTAAKESLRNQWDWCKSPDIGLPAPDAILYLDLSSDDAASRGGYGNERYEKREFQEIARSNFMKLKDIDDNTINHSPEWHILDASKSIEELSENIQNITLNVINHVKNEPINLLWTNNNNNNNNENEEEKKDSSL